MSGPKRSGSFSSSLNTSDSTSTFNEKVKKPVPPFRLKQEKSRIFKPWQHMKHLYIRWQAYIRSRNIDKFLDKESKHRMERTLLLGSDRRIYSPWFYAVQKHELGSLVNKERSWCKPKIFNLILDALKYCIYALEEQKLPFKNESSKAQADIITHASYFDNESQTPFEDLAQAISLLWGDPAIRSIYESSFQPLISGCPRSYFEDIERLSSPQYLPSEEDVRYVYDARRPFQSHGSITFEDNDASWFVTQISYHGGERKKWIHFYEHFSSLLFTVDLRSYADTFHNGFFDGNFSNFMKEQMILWDSIVNNKWFTGFNVALCFIKNGEFCRLVREKPIDQYFEDCQIENPSDTDQAREFVVSSFLALNKNREAKSTTVRIIDDIPREGDWEAVKAFFERSSRSKQSSTKSCGLRWHRWKTIGWPENRDKV